MTFDALWLDSIIKSFRQSVIDDIHERPFTLRCDESGQFICVVDFIRCISNCSPKIAQSRMSRLPKHIKLFMKRRVLINENKNKRGDKRGLNQPCTTASLCVCLAIGLCFCAKRKTFLTFFTKQHIEFFKFITNKSQDFDVLYQSLYHSKRHIDMCQQLLSYLEFNRSSSKYQAELFYPSSKHILPIPSTHNHDEHPLSPLLPMPQTQTHTQIKSPVESSTPSSFSFQFPTG